MNASQVKAAPPNQVLIGQLSEKCRDLQERAQQATEAHAKLAAQETECKIVKEELENLESDAQIYKMIGACLVKEEKSQADENLKFRLQYISKEMENNKKTADKNMEELDKLVQEIQKIHSP